MRGVCFLAALVCVGCADEPSPLKDRPLGTKVHFEAIHYADGKDRPRQLIVRGTLDGPGELELNPNQLMLDSRGRVQGSTLLGWSPIKVRIKPTDAPDPDKKGRKVYDLVPEKGEPPRRYSMILSANEAGPHSLFIHEDEKVIGTYPLVDPDRREHLELAPKLARASAEEQRAIVELRKAVGYSFHFRLEDKDAVTFLYFPEAGEVGKLDSGLKGLTNLKHLIFNRGRLGPEGLKNLRGMRELRVLDFTDSEIDDRGLACVEGLTPLTAMSFFGSRGLSDAGVAHLKGIKNLTLLDLRNEGFTATEPKSPRVTDAGLAHLTGLSKLEYLNLQGQHVTDAGLKHLRRMADLQTLSLSFGGITDEGLEQLQELRKLRHLHLYGTRITPAGRAALKAKLPMLDR